VASGSVSASIFIWGSISESIFNSDFDSISASVFNSDFSSSSDLFFDSIPSSENSFILTLSSIFVLLLCAISFSESGKFSSDFMFSILFSALFWKSFSSKLSVFIWPFSSKIFSSDSCCSCNISSVIFLVDTFCFSDILSGRIFSVSVCFSDILPAISFPDLFSCIWDLSFAEFTILCHRRGSKVSVGISSPIHTLP